MDLNLTNPIFHDIDKARAWWKPRAGRTARSASTRGIAGVYQHCGEQHLQRYLNEFSFRSGKGMTEQRRLGGLGAD